MPRLLKRKYFNFSV